MIYSLRGKVIHKEAGLAVIECGGVGYACRAPYSTLMRLEKDKDAYLYTYMSVREDGVELFGFATAEELNCFRQLTSVSGVGPKAGLAILSDTSPEKFALAVATGDSKAFTKTKGVGSKLAQRIILELKDKITKEQFASGGLPDISPEAVSGSGNIGEAVSALVVLGYSQSEAAAALSGLDEKLPAEELIKQSLKKIAMSAFKK